MIVNKSLYPVSRDLRSISQMQKQFENLQLQLATGKRYNTLAEMGSDRVHDLNIRNRLSRIEGFGANIQTAETRMSFYTNALERLDDIEADARALAVPGAYGTDGINFVNARNQATNLLREVIDVLNTDITGQYIFGGNKSDTKPVASFDEMMAGFTDFVDDSLAANGVLARGLVTVGAVDNGSVTITADGGGQGIQIDGVTAGTGHSIDLSAASEGKGIDISYSLPGDSGGSRTLTLAGVDARVDPVPAGSFAVVRDADGNVDADATAENFKVALEASLDHVAKGEMRSALTYKAADDFFVGRNAAADPSGWYRGQDAEAGKNPRQTVSVNVDENTKAHYGVQANEAGFVELIKGLAVFAVSEDMGELNDLNAARYEEMVATQRARLSEDNNAKPGSIELITMELGLAASTINTVKERHTQYTAQLETMLSDIATAPRQEIAMMLLTLQTQLQASYQATSMASQLTLVNYLR